MSSILQPVSGIILRPNVAIPGRIIPSVKSPEMLKRGCILQKPGCRTWKIEVSMGALPSESTVLKSTALSQDDLRCRCGLSDTWRTPIQNPRRYPSETSPSRTAKTGLLFIPAICTTILPEIVPVISAICVLHFTSEKWVKSANYARFLGIYARNPRPDPGAGYSLDPCYRRRILYTTGRKVCLNS